MAACRQWDRLWQHPSLGPGFCSLAPGCRHRRGKKTSFSWILQEQCICFCVFFTLFCCVIALDGMEFIPGDRKDILVLSWFREVQGLQTSCSWSGSSGITCCGFLTLVVCPSPSHQHLLVELLQHRITSLYFEDFFFLQRFQSLLRVSCWVCSCDRLIGRKIRSQNMQVRQELLETFLFVPFPPIPFTSSRSSGCFSLAAS